MKNIFLGSALLSISFNMAGEDTIIEAGNTNEVCEDCSTTELVLHWIKRSPEAIRALQKAPYSYIRVYDDRLDTLGQKAEGTFVIRNNNSDIATLEVEMEITEVYHQEQSAELMSALDVLNSNNSVAQDSLDTFTQCKNKLYASYNKDKKELTVFTRSTCTMNMPRAMLLTRLSQTK